MHWVYTDGACVNNGRHNCPKQTGWGMFWGDGNPANNCGPIFVVDTNNYAELVAVYNALKSGLLQGIRNLTIFTDSEHVVNIFNDFIHKWKRYNGKRPSNLRIIMAIDRMMRDYQQVLFQHVEGHGNDYGNQMADKLAREGANKTQQNIGLPSFNFFNQLKRHVKNYFFHCQQYSMDGYGEMDHCGLMEALMGLNRRITDQRFFNRIGTYYGKIFSFAEFVIIAELACRDMDACYDDRRYPMIEYDDEVNNGRFKISNAMAEILENYYDEEWEHFDEALDEYMCLAGLWQSKYDFQY